MQKGFCRKRRRVHAPKSDVEGKADAEGEGVERKEGDGGKEEEGQGKALGEEGNECNVKEDEKEKLLPLEQQK